MTNPQRDWCFWAVSAKEKRFQAHSYYDHPVYGVYNVSHGTVFTPKSCKVNITKFDPSKFGNCEIDLYLDCELKQFKMCIVGQDSKDIDDERAREAIWNDVDTDEGLVPHFNFSSDSTGSQKVQIARVSLSWYGKKMNIQWHKDPDEGNESNVYFN